MARGQQKQLPGIERESIPEINAAAEAYVKARDKRMELTKDEVATHEALAETMKRHKVKVYKDSDADPPLIMTLTATEVVVKVKVSIAPKDPEPQPDGEKNARADRTSR